MARPLIGRTIRRLRIEQRLTQQALAARLGVSASYLNLIEHDQRAVTASLLLKLARPAAGRSGGAVRAGGAPARGRAAGGAGRPAAGHRARCRKPRCRRWPAARRLRRGRCWRCIAPGGWRARTPAASRCRAAGASCCRPRRRVTSSRIAPTISRSREAGRAHRHGTARGPVRVESRHRRTPAPHACRPRPRRPARTAACGASSRARELLDLSETLPRESRASSWRSSSCCWRRGRRWTQLIAPVANHLAGGRRPDPRRPAELRGRRRC